MNNKLSIAFYPQTDGQIERFNQIVEQYLKCYINYDQNDWVKYLPMVQFIYNISIYVFIKQTLFFVIYKYYLKIYKISTIELNNLYATIKIEYFKFLYDRLKNEFSFVKDRMAKYYNIKKMKEPSFKEGDKIYLLYKNIIIKRSNNKLNFKKFRFFIII